MITAKPSERPPTIRYVIRTPDGFYYTGHGYGLQQDSQGGQYEATGESGVPGFDTKNIMFAVKYGDTVSIEALIKNHKKWCIDQDRQELFDLLDKCDVLETYT